METVVHKRSSTIAMHKQSHTISKSKPKIRIVHIFAPEIIKTDAANFRELVQRLTGKPEDDDNYYHGHLRHDRRQKGTKKNPGSRRDQHHHHQLDDNMKKTPIFPTKKTAMENVFCTELEEATTTEQEEEEEEEVTWSADNVGNSGGGFFNSLGDLDGFIQELGEFPYLPLAAIDGAAPSSSSSSSHNMHGGFAESQPFAI